MQSTHAMHYVPARQGPCITYTGQNMNVKLSAAESNEEMTVIESIVDPKAGPPLHVHEKENEAYYVLEGEFEFVCGEDTARGGPGTFVFAPRRVPHRYANIGNAPGRILFGFTPGGIEAFFSQPGNLNEFTPEKVTRVAWKYGITMLLGAGQK
jgi:mannose-6-phosphate isomerase-like protein (cupin superfamily)